MKVAIRRNILRYDKLMYWNLLRDYYGQSDFFNFGYWLEDTRNQPEACENLMEKLLEFIPETKGSILDVACGMGASTKHLLRYYDASDVVGINISAKQLETCRTNAPGCKFILMDAATLEFPDGQFDNMVCVESVFYFDTRERFLNEAYRVLKPGGRLVLSDILHTKLPWSPKIVIKENHVKNLDAYRDIYVRAGFQDVQVIEATSESWKGFRRGLMRCIWDKFFAREIGVRDLGELALQFLRIAILSVGIKHYLLVSAKKA